jgi:cobalt/nickel transport system permease protein
MHMADALISAAVGGTMLAATSGLSAYSVKKIEMDIDEKKIPLMGVMGAFVFAAQMINFSIPGTGSSGHIGGGMLLAILLGPYAGFLTMASILLIQALFFADGGLLAFGCNVFNLGFYTCFIAYPFIFRKITAKGFDRKRLFAASVISSVIGLQMGAFSLVLETVFSRKTELPFGTFVLLMQPIHLAIGIVEGLVTAAVVIFVWQARPEIIENGSSGKVIKNVSVRNVFIGLMISAIMIGGIFSWFASSKPDGLEWSVFKTLGKEEIEVSDVIHDTLGSLQSKSAFLPDYNFKNVDENNTIETGAKEAKLSENSGTSVSGIVGGILTLAFICISGFSIKIIKRRMRTHGKYNRVNI